MTQHRLSDEYLNGVKEFLDFAFSHSSQPDKILCPCINCNNVYYKSRDEVQFDLVSKGIVPSYINWYYHGEYEFEEEEVSDEAENDNEGVYTMLEEALGMPNINQERGGALHILDEPNEDAKKFYRLLKDAQQVLYPGCTKFSKLSFLIKLLHLKCRHGWSNKSFSMLLQLLKDAFPEGETMPSSYYEARKIIQDLGLHYEKIDACPNNCILFWKEYANANQCVKCGASRWMFGMVEDNGTKGVRKKIPMKILRYFPLKPRLQRLYMSSKIASDMTWHEEDRINDGLLRHPADSQAWKKLDELYPSFALEPRNVRLGLASDGFNPFGNMSIAHSTWPVVLVPYNLPPWMSMKKSFFMLSLLIPGPKAPGNDIDVFLKPLIDELKDLWEVGIETYDASRKQNFRLHAAVLWTINDFPAYANLSGWSTKGRWACPSCNKYTCSHYLKHGRKMCYMGHRRFLPMNHRWRNNRTHFDGTKELREKPPQLSGNDVLDQLCISERERMKKSGPSKTNKDWLSNWKKKSIFFELPYWKTLLLHHNLDVMHIEKNVCENVLSTLLNIEGKTKDGLKARLDLKEMCIREQLHPIEEGDRILLPSACYTLSSNEKFKLCEFLKEVKVPDGYSSNISQCVNLKERKISALKSHDYHILMQRLLPLAIRKLLPKDVCEALIELSNFFRELCSKVLKVKELEHLESQIVETLCKLERIFPPTFFDVMVHLPIHLSSEAKIAGPVQYRWMYPIERFVNYLIKFTIISYKDVYYLIYLL